MCNARSSETATATETETAATKSANFQPAKCEIEIKMHQTNAKNCNEQRASEKRLNLSAGQLKYLLSVRQYDCNTISCTLKPYDN